MHPIPTHAESLPMTTTRSFALASLLAATLAGPAAAQTQVDLISGPVDFTTWALQGSATADSFTPGNGFTYSVLRLTQPGLGDQRGAGFAPEALLIDFNQSFQFDWVWSIPNIDGLRGDGYTFTLNTQQFLGGGGSDLGYRNDDPNNSIALAVDTFDFGDPGEAISPSLQLLAAGSITPLAATETGLGDALRDPDFAWFARLSYTPSGLDDNTGTLLGRIEHINLGTFEVQADVDFAALGMVGEPVYYGFTASNGLATDGHTIQWGAPLPVPEPGTWVLLAVGLAALRLRHKHG